MLNTIFFGTPSVAVPFLELLHQTTNILLVVTQPDRPCGRGLTVQACQVKTRALELGLKVISPEKFKDSVPYIATLNADMGVAVAYGKIFRKPALDAIKLGIINIHFSLLPKCRGAAPVQHTFFNGEDKTGISAFWIDEGLDSGPIASIKEIPITAQDDSATMFPKLIALGQDALASIIDDINAGKITKIPQSGQQTLAPMIDKSQTFISFKDMTAKQIYNMVRGLACAMPATAKATTINGDIVQILKTDLRDEPQNVPTKFPVGAIVLIERNKGFFVQCKEDVLFVELVRPAGKNTMNAAAFLNGKNISEAVGFFI